MATGSNNFKLGVLAIVMVAGVLAIVFVFGTARFRSATIDYTTYFDESVQGLERGALVKYRGVHIGNVDSIGVAPDRKLIAVQIDINKDTAQRLQLAQRVATVRAQLVTQGITGVKLIDLELVDPAEWPPMTLTFEPPERYIPSRPSLLSRVGTKAETFADRLPELEDRAEAVLIKLEGLIDDVRQQGLPAQLSDTLTDAKATSQELRRRTARTFGNLDRAITKLQRILDQAGGNQGLVASARRATESLGDVGRSSLRSSQELERTLISVREAAQAIREFMDALEREPDMLIKGRARRARP